MDYVRVTEILSIFQGYNFVPRERLKKAQEIGTDIHDAIERYFLKCYEPLSLKKMPYFESFLHWAKEYEPSPWLLETRFNDDDLKVTGKVDLVARIKEKVFLVDFKTGAWINQEVWNLQLHWYRHLLEVNQYSPLPKKFLIVQLMKDGSPPILYEFAYDTKVEEACYHALEMWKYFNKEVVTKSEGS